MTTETKPFDLSKQLTYRLGVDPQHAGPSSYYKALAHEVRERLLDRWLETERRTADARKVSYLSLEFHIGRLLRSALQALDLEQEAAAALPEGVTLDALEDEEPDANIGSGGLGRLAACFLDSLATLDLPARGYGLRYELGLTKQLIRDGAQVEAPDPWLDHGSSVWLVRRQEHAVPIRFGGHVEHWRDADGRLHYRWAGGEEVLAVPYDVPVAGYGTRTVNTLRLWSAQPTEQVDLEAFGSGQFSRAWRPQVLARSLNAFLYPTDTTTAGRELRLKQQFMLASATLQDLLRHHLGRGAPLSSFAERNVLQLNDTHPAIAIPELMRLLVDVHELTWEEAWVITQKTFAYTNHTLLPEALETWPVDLLGRLLPRQLEIVSEIDRRFQGNLRARFPDDGDRLARMAIVDRRDGQRVKMANLAVVGSFAVNGVAALHTELLKAGLMRDLYEMFPDRFSNKTNGITPRRWLRQCNPGLAALVTDRLGPGWERDLDLLRGLEAHADDPEFQAAFRAVKLANKQRLARVIQRETGIEVEPTALFDVLIKRIHEYKRQLLLVLWAIHRWQSLRANPDQDVVPRVVIFGGKAAPSYAVAKNIVRLIHGVATVVHADPAVRGRLKLVFIPNYRVSLAQAIVPAADLSEQISTAGYEASGTGNMKLALNGALTIGTLDGANVEIKEEVGDENIFIFGLEADEVRDRRAHGYQPREVYEQDERLRSVLDAIQDDTFGSDFEGLVHALLDWDQYMLLADFDAYVATQDRVEAAWRDEAAWTRAAILNTARVGKFSSDRTIAEYAKDIWRLEASPPGS